MEPYVHTYQTYGSMRTHASYRTFRLDVAVDYRNGTDWTRLDWIGDLVRTDCLPVAGTIIVKLGQPCVRMLVQAYMFEFAACECCSPAIPST